MALCRSLGAFCLVASDPLIEFSDLTRRHYAWGALCPFPTSLTQQDIQ